MKFQNRVLLSCVVASLLSSGAYASCSGDIEINSPNTTGVTLNCSGNLNVTSSGSIKLSYESDTSVAVNSYSNGTILNLGHITVDSNSTDYVAGIQQKEAGANIINKGHIDVNSTGTPDGTSGIWTYGNDINITNTGTITVSSSSGWLAGILSKNSFGKIVNSGTITVDSNGTLGAGIVGMHQDITNSGTITVNSTGNHNYNFGIYGWESNITNSGTITVDGASGYNTGIYAHSDINTTITNTTSGTITASTAIRTDGDGASTILIQNQGIINTSAIYAPTSTLVNSGTINLHNSDRFDGASIISVGTFNQTSTGTLSIDAHLTDTNGTVSATNPTVRAGSATLADGSTINVNVMSDSTATTKTFLDQNGTINNVIVAAYKGGVVDANTTKLNITDDSPVLDFEAFMNDSNTTLSLKAVESTTIAPKDSPMTAVSTPTIGAETLNILNTVIQARQSDMRGLGSGDIAFKDRHMWFKPFGMYTKQDNKDGINGFDAHTYGFGMGIDGEYKEGKRAGLAFFYSNTNLDINDIIQSNSLDVFNLIAYGSNPIADDKTMLFYQAGAGVQKNNAKRYVSQNNQTAKADYTSQSYYAQVKVTRDYDINDKLIVTPAIKGALRYFKSPSYTESGAGAYNLSVDSVSTTQVLLGLAANIKYKINDKTKFISNLALDYDFNNDAQSVDAYYQGTPGVIFSTSGIKNSALSYGLGLGISRELKKNLVLNLKYSLNGRGSDFINHSIQAKFRWRF